MLQIWRKNQKKKEKEEIQRIQLLRDLSCMRKTCDRNIAEAYEGCRDAVNRADPLSNTMATCNAHLIKSNAALLKKCNDTLLGLQVGELRRKGGMIDGLNRLEFNASYREAKKGARKSNTNKLRRRAQKLEKYRSICDWNRQLINDCLQDGYADMFDDDNNDSDGDSDVAELVECVREQGVIDTVLSAPNPSFGTPDRETENVLLSVEMHDET